MALILAKEVLGGHDEEAASRTTILEQSQSAGRLHFDMADETRGDETRRDGHAWDQKTS